MPANFTRRRDLLLDSGYGDPERVLAALSAEVAALGLPAEAFGGRKDRLSRKALAVSFLVTSLLLAGVVSWLASSSPDGLEWSYRGHTYARADGPIANSSQAVGAVEAWQARWSPMSGYGRRQAALGELPGGQDAARQDDSARKGAWPNMDGYGSLAGLLGTLACLAIIYCVSRLVGRRRVPLETSAHAATGGRHAGRVAGGRAPRRD